MAESPLFKPVAKERRGLESWKALIVDDEQGIHDVTYLALKRFVFQNRPINFYHAYSGAEACEIMRQHPDMALVLLDVVMEEDDAGLKTVQYIRETLNNHLVRIVLRTGQPGAAPEEDVIRDYDINDYKDKTELTVQKLKTVMYSALRSYRDLQALEIHRAGLQRVIESSADLFRKSHFDDFVNGLLVQISSILDLNGNILMATSRNHSLLLAGVDDQKSRPVTPTILSGSGRFEQAGGKAIDQVLRDSDLELIQSAIDQRQTIIDDDHAAFLFSNHRGDIGLVYLTDIDNLSEVNRDLIQLFTQNLSIAYDNITLYQELDETQRELLLRLGNIAEFRCGGNNQHVNRVAYYSELLALKSGLNADQARLIRMASPMHDIGKLGIPDHILTKPDRLTDSEFERMKQHCDIGYEMLKGSDRPLLKAASIIAQQHQEKWDGSGYPNGLSGEAIHIYGRIVALVDVFDALSSERCYKQAWPLERVTQLIRDQSGKHFDPRLARILLQNLDDFIEIRD